MLKTYGILVILYFFTLLSLAGCSDSSEPERDFQAPNVDVLLQLENLDSHCLFWPRLSADPRGSSDNKTDVSGLKIRWDFFNDGEWDSDFGDLDIIFHQFSEPPLEDVWNVRCEVQDEAGNSRIWEGTLDYPVDDWPDSPDIIASAISIIPEEMSTTEVDTMIVGQEYLFRAFRRDWMPESFLPYEVEFFVDENLIYRGTLVGFSGLDSCMGLGYPIPEEFMTVGTHDLVVVFDSGGVVTETDETNNTFSRSVVVVE